MSTRALLEAAYRVDTHRDRAGGVRWSRDGKFSKSESTLPPLAASKKLHQQGATLLDSGYPPVDAPPRRYPVASPPNSRADIPRKLPKSQSSPQKLPKLSDTMNASWGDYQVRLAPQTEIYAQQTLGPYQKQFKPFNPRDSASKLCVPGKQEVAELSSSPRMAVPRRERDRSGLPRSPAKLHNWQNAQVLADTTSVATVGVAASPVASPPPPKVPLMVEPPAPGGSPPAPQEGADAPQAGAQKPSSRPCSVDNMLDEISSIAHEITDELYVDMPSMERLAVMASVTTLPRSTTPNTSWRAAALASVPRAEQEEKSAAEQRLQQHRDGDPQALARRSLGKARTQKNLSVPDLSPKSPKQRIAFGPTDCTEVSVDVNQELTQHQDGVVNDELPEQLEQEQPLERVLSGSGNAEEHAPQLERTRSRSTESEPPKMSEHQVDKQMARRASAQGSAVSIQDGLDEHGLLKVELKWQRVQATVLEGGLLDEEEVKSLRGAFRRFQAQHCQEVRKDDLAELIQYLGYVMTSDEEVQRIANDVTPYNDLDFNDFLLFVEKYVAHECAVIQQFFGDFDVDDSGTISVQELRSLMSAIGFIPAKSMIMEALAQVEGADAGPTELVFRQFVHFLTVYRHAQGFTKEEVKDLRQVYDSFSEGEPNTPSYGLPYTALARTLIQSFGLQFSDSAARISSRLCRERRAATTAKSEAHALSDNVDVLDFHEYLIFARRLKEEEQAQYRAEFEKHDHNDDGKMQIDELQSALRNLGHEPMRGVIIEVLREVDFETDGELDVEEFFNFMMVYQEREGFTRTELEDMRNVFCKFDDDKSLSISVHEMGDLLRYLGHSVGVDDVHLLIAEVDVDRSGDLDFREFLRLMRLHRKHEIRRLRKVFLSHVNAKKPDSHKSREGTAVNGLRLVGEEVKAALVSALGQVPPVLFQALPQLILRASRGGGSAPPSPTNEQPLIRKRKSVVRKSFKRKITRQAGDMIEALADSVPELSDRSASFLDKLGSMVSAESETPLENLDDLQTGGIVQVLSDSEAVKQACIRAGLMDSTSSARSATVGTAVYVVEKDKNGHLVKCHSPLHGDLWFVAGALTKARCPSELVEAFSETLTALASCNGRNGIDFDAFVQLSDLGRAVRTAWERMQAGFSDTDIQRFKAVFSLYDIDQSGDIDDKELLQLLQHVGVECKSKETQQLILRQLEQAREKAKGAGVHVKDSTSVISFWEFVQLMRIIRSQRDREIEQHIEEVAQEVGFTWQEVAQFREIFIQWSRKDRSNQRRQVDKEDTDNLLGDHKEDGLSLSTFHNIVRSLGVPIRPDHENILARQYQQHEKNRKGQITFEGFLRMMRWLLDSDFAGVNKVVAQTVANAGVGAFKQW